MNWEDLHLFYQVAAEGSITRVAENLGLSQPALSRTIINLEKHLNRHLFFRRKYGIELTPEGDILFKHVRDMSQLLRHAEHIIEEDPSSLEGELIIGTTPALASSWLLKFLPLFIDAYPDMRVKVIHEYESGPNSVADVHIRPCSVVDPTFIHKYVLKFSMGLYASFEYLKNNGIPKNAEDLSDHNLVSFSGKTANTADNINWILKVGNRTSSPRDASLKLSSAEYLLAAAERGLGIVELGKGYPAKEGVDLIEILPELSGPTAEVFFIYPEYKRNSRKINALWEHIQNISGSAGIEASLDDFSAVKMDKIG